MALTAYTSDFITRGGLIVQGTGTVSSSTVQTGAVQLNGGAAIAKNLIVGTTADVYGNAVLHSNLSVTGTTVLDQTLSVGGDLTLINDSRLNWAYGSYIQENGISHALSVNGGTSLELNGHGPVTLVTPGGTATLNSIGNFALPGELSVTNTATFSGTVFVTGSNVLTVGTGAVTLGGTLDAAGVVTFTNATTAASSAGGSGALKLTGGAYVGDNLLVMSTSANTSTDVSNALYVAGGVWIDRSLVVNQDAIFKGNTIFQGTATYVYSTQSVYTDNLIELHVPPDGEGTAWSLDDGKDIGLRFNYYNGSDKNAAMVFSHSTRQFEFFKDGAEGTSTFSTGVYSDIKAANATFVGTDTAASTASGALQVVGGIGLGKDLYAGGDVSGNRLAARNLTLASIPVIGDSGILIEDSALTFDLANHKIIGEISTATFALTATTATNINGGDRGFLPYQSAPGVTAFLNTATASDGYVLTFVSGLPVWQAASGSVASADNISGGLATEIPFQTGPGATSFSTDFEYDDTAKTLKVANVTVYGKGDLTGTYTSDNAIAAISGQSIGLYSNVDARLDYNNTNYVVVDTNGAKLVTAGGNFSLAASGDATLSNGGTLSAEVIHATTTTNASNTSSGALVVTGGAAVGKDLHVGGSVYVAGDIFLDGVGLDTVSGTTATFLNVNVTGTGVTLNVTDSIEVGGNVNITGRTTATTIVATTQVKVTSITNSTATNNGSITTLGGVGIAQDVVVGGAITVGTVSTSSVVPALYSNNVLLASYTKTNISGNSAVNLDTFAHADYRTARYTIQIVDGTDIHVTEMSIFHNGTDVWMNEYGMHHSNGLLGTFDALIVGSNVTLKFIPTSATAMTIKVVRFGITA